MTDANASADAALDPASDPRGEPVPGTGATAVVVPSRQSDADTPQRRQGREASPERWRPRSSVPVLMARMLLLAAGLILLRVVFGGTHWVQWLVTAFSTFVFPISGVGIGSAVMFVVLGVALQRRKRAAWIIALIIFVVLWLLSLVFFGVLVVEVLRHWQPNPPGDVSLSPNVFNVFSIGVILTLLVAHRREFAARTARGNLGKAVLTFVVGVAMALGVGALIASEFGQHRHPARGSFAMLRRIMLGSGAGTTPGIPHWGQTIVSLLVGLSLLAAMIVLLRSQQAAATMDLADEITLRRLMLQHEPDSLGYFATRRDKAVVFSPQRDAGIAYRSQFGVCLAAGDPIGAPDHWPAAMDAWLDHAHRYGLNPAVVGASEEGARAFTQHGLRALRVGDEAILHPARFDLGSRDLRAVAQTVRRLERLGYEVVVRRHRDIAPDELRQIIDDTDAWRSTDDERGFSMALGRLGDPLDGDCLMVQALFPAGHVPGGGHTDGVHAGPGVRTAGERSSVDRTAGVLSFVPWGRHGYSLDVMRRHPEADNGVTELMVSGLMSAGRDLGIECVSLNFAVFRAALEEGSRVGATPVMRMQRRVLMMASRWFQIEQLYRSNVKYAPDWQPRFLCYEEASDIPSVGLALAVAEGYLVLPAKLDPVRPQEHVDAGDPRVVAWLEEAQAMPELAPVRQPEQVRQRMALRQRLLDEDAQPYPVETGVTAHCDVVADPGERAGQTLTIAGRVLGISDHGGVVFCRIQDWSGRTQVLLERRAVGADSLATFSRTIGLGDQVAFTGVCGASNTGTPSLLVNQWQLISKCLRPLPDKYHGMSDSEALVRQRYLDLIMNPDSRKRLRARSTAIQAVRQTMLDHHYLEVETPILQTIHGGANARPFRTHINAYDLDLYLRIAPELYLKRLMVGGVDRIFEIGRNFRNEGADATHNPEFTVIEAYAANGTYHTMRDITEDMVRRAAIAANGTTVVRGRSAADGSVHEIDLAEPWRWVPVHQGISEGLGEEITPDTTRDELVRHCERLGIEVDPRENRGKVLDELYDVFCEKPTVAPTFFCDFPAETSPLTRPHRHDARLAERWDLVVFGSELGTAYSELVDPVIQRQRLTQQSLQAAGGDPEAMEIDEEFLMALEYGMPPTGGLGIGLDRLVMLLTGASIRETITFPLVRPRKN